MKKIIILGIILIMIGSVQGLIIEENTGVSLPCILIDDTDFKTQETGVGGGSVTVKYKRTTESTWNTKDVSGSGWDEIGEGVYEIDFSSGEIGSYAGANQGIFLYMVEGSGYLPYYGCAQMIPQSLKDNSDDINAILTDTSAQDTTSELRTMMTGGNNVVATQSNLTQGIVVLTTATETQIDNIESDTNEIQGNQSSFVTDISTLATQNNLTQGIVILSTATETQINNIEADTNEIQGNQSNFGADVSGLATQSNITSLQTHGDTFWKTNTTSIATAVWDASMSDHIDIGTFGKIIRDIYYAIFEWGGGGF